MTALLLLNDVDIMTGSGAVRVRAGETVSDAATQVAIQGVGGVLWPANDATVLAQAAIALKLRAKAGNEEAVSRLMLGAAALSAVQADVAGSIIKSAADGAAANPTAETIVSMVAPTAGGLITTCYFLPGAALASNDTNYATIQLQKRTNSTPGTAVTVAQVTTQTTGGGGSGSWTAWQAVPIPIVAGTVGPLDVLTWNIAKAGSGVVVPVGTLLFFAN